MIEIAEKVNFYVSDKNQDMYANETNEIKKKKKKLQNLS